jgi:tripartite-type tricarboxylate transporter receptor subunit TctC
VHEDTIRILQSADFAARLAQLGMVPYLKDPQAFAQTIKTESVHWAKIAKARKLVVQ